MPHIRSTRLGRTAPRVAIVLLTIISIFTITMSPAEAFGTFVHRYCINTYKHATPNGHEWVSFCYGFDYSGGSTNRLRGYSRMVAHSDGDPILIHLEATERLGDRNGVLAESRGYSTQGWLDLDTAGYVYCHRTTSAYYLSHLYLTVRWSDGVLERFDTGQFGLHALEPDPILGACVNTSVDWYVKP
ncbi:MAG TPA: hypothetical protein VJT72_06595 [Pseudonocardiaceae bacterium]|nr:hypothetical protein [Pseudonocardiaceae bacterium]